MMDEQYTDPFFDGPDQASELDIETTLAELIAGLAKLPRLEYEQSRDAFSKKHKIRVTVLDDEVCKARPKDDTDDVDRPEPFETVQPWDQPVNGADLLDIVLHTLERFCVLPPHSAPLVTSWIVHAWAHDAAVISPVLAFNSPEKRCGKSTTMSVVGAMTPKPMHAVNISASVLFRVIEKYKPTVLIDEVDTFLEDRAEMRGMINGGHNRQTAYVWRSVCEDHEHSQFCVWAPKAVAMIGSLPDTIKDRALVVSLKRKEKCDIVERFHLRRDAEMQPIRRMLARWVEDNRVSLEAQEPDVPDELDDRAQDNARCLCAIADVAGGEWPERIRTALIGMAASRVDDTPTSKGVMLLRDVADVLERWKGSRITSNDLVAELVAIEDGPWEVWKGGDPITARMVASLLKPYCVKPERDRASRFYVLEDLRDAVGRYVS